MSEVLLYTISIAPMGVIFIVFITLSFYRLKKFENNNSNETRKIKTLHNPRSIRKNRP